MLIVENTTMVVKGRTNGKGLLLVHVYLHIYAPRCVLVYAISNVVIRNPTYSWQDILYTMLSDIVCRTLLCVRSVSIWVTVFTTYQMHRLDESKILLK
jgi:hypothetical protein